MTSCPHCNSADVATSAAVYEQGAQMVAGKTVGVGVTGGGSVGLGVAKSKGTTVSLAALKNAPPKASELPSTLAAIVWLGVWVGGYVTFHWHGVWWQAPLAGLFLGLVVAGWISQKLAGAQALAQSDYARRWYCKTCGNTFNV